VAGLWRKVAWTSCFGDGGGWDGGIAGCGVWSLEFGVWREEFEGVFDSGMIEIYDLWVR
jgi:hypothetical protein